MNTPAVTEILTEILTGLVIQTDLTISHAQQPDFGVDEAIVDRLADNPELKTKFLTQHLQSYLSGTYFSQVYREPDNPSEVFANDEAIFIGRLRAANCGGGYYDPDWLVRSISPDGHFIAIKDGLSLKMPAQSLYTPNDEILVGELVAAAMPNNLMKTDRYVAIGNAGRLPNAPVTNIYWNCDPQTAIDLVDSITRSLNPLAIPFELQVESSLDSYHRLEPLILGVLCTDYSKVAPLLQQIARCYPTRNGIPPLTMQLAPGIGVAETANPEIDYAARCCRSISIGIISCLENPDPVTQILAIERELINNRIIDLESHLVHTDNMYKKWCITKKSDINN
jgi:HopA1 effector protein family